MAISIDLAKNCIIKGPPQTRILPTWTDNLKNLTFKKKWVGDPGRLFQCAAISSLVSRINCGTFKQPPGVSNPPFQKSQIFEIVCPRRKNSRLRGTLKNVYDGFVLISAFIQLWRKTLKTLIFSIYVNLYTCEA